MDGRILTLFCDKWKQTEVRSVEALQFLIDGESLLYFILVKDNYDSTLIIVFIWWSHALTKAIWSTSGSI